MKFIHFLPFYALVLAATSFPRTTEAQEKADHQLKLDLDPLLAMPSLWALTVETLPQKCAAEGFRSNPFFVWSGKSEGARDRAVFSRKPYNNVSVDLTVFSGQVPVEQAVFELKDGKVASVQITARAQHASPESLAQWRATCEAAVAKAAGAPSVPGARLFGFKGTKNAKTLTWAGATTVAALDFSAEDKVLGLSFAPAGTSVGALLSKPLSVAQPGEGLFVNLDPLLALPALWSLTPDKLETDFAMSGFQESPFYQWLTADKSGVRFSKHPYSNVSVDLGIFGGTVSADELVIEFTAGKATRASVSLFNRGDSGEITRPEFERRFKAAGVAMGKLLGVRPTERKPSAQTAIKISGWTWMSPTALASLEYNTEAMGSGSAEFLRLKLAEPGARDAFASESGQSIRSNALGKSELPKFVKRESNGDVYVSGVPMVDQGDKGYCVVAACQRLFSYLRIPVDQHELAQIAGSDATRGTNSQEIDDTLKKIDSRFKVKYKPLAYRYTSGHLGVPYGNRVNDVDADKFTRSVEEYTSKGIPMLWALELGRFPEEPANAAQGGGGHMRLIIGSNSKTGDVLFTDSWGAGHELKRMKMGDAYRATTALWIIEPKEH